MLQVVGNWLCDTLPCASWPCPLQQMHTSAYIPSSRGKRHIVNRQWQTLLPAHSSENQNKAYLILLSPDKKGKKEFLIPNFIVTWQKKEKKQTARAPTPHHTHLQALHHATPLHITTLPNLINLDHKRTPHLYTAPPPKLINQNSAKTHQSEPNHNTTLLQIKTPPTLVNFSFHNKHHQRKYNFDHQN